MSNGEGGLTSSKITTTTTGLTEIYTERGGKTACRKKKKKETTDKTAR